MSQSASLQDLARGLLRHERDQNPSREREGFLAFPVCEKLRQSLSRLMGVAGFCALLSRALTLARREVAWLEGLRVGKDGRLEGAGEAGDAVEAGEISEGDVVLVAHVLGLLVIFVGPMLTRRLLQGIWPDLEPMHLDKEDIP